MPEARLTPGQVMNTQVVSEPSMLDKAKDFLFKSQSKGDITAAANAEQIATPEYLANATAGLDTSLTSVKPR